MTSQVTVSKYCAGALSWVGFGSSGTNTADQGAPLMYGTGPWHWVGQDLSPKIAIARWGAPLRNIAPGPFGALGEV